ncbi:MAG: hypothetical protein J0I41_19465 [Filimonas sp.]|nr:hypothetical protein [Filimonas sp.]
MKIVFAAAIGLTFLATGCTKNNDSVKESLEKALPSIELTSLGMIQQVGPFATTDAIAVNFGGALTKTTAGAFDIAWYDNNTRTDSAHFDSWNMAASTANGNNVITTTMVPTTYPNTNAFSGILALKLAKLSSGKSYTLKAYARTTTGEMATVSITKMITIK